MTVPSTASNDLLEKNDTLDEGKALPPTDITIDAIENPLQQIDEAGDWDSPENSENPLKWSTAKKAYHSAIPSIYCFTVYVSDAPLG